MWRILRVGTDKKGRQTYTSDERKGRLFQSAIQADTAHFAWSFDCLVFKRRIDMERRRINNGDEWP